MTNNDAPKMADSPYFFVDKSVTVDSFEELLELTNEKLYGFPGQLYNNLNSIIYSSNNTNGLFRGQSDTWALVPTAYRNVKAMSEKPSESSLIYSTLSQNGDLSKFCELAGSQNRDFPRNELEQMIIAQHFGISTPLLDWTKNIFVAIYFAMDLCDETWDREKNTPVIYHIRDERLVGGEEDNVSLAKEKRSFYAKAFPIDRRVERQAGCFTFHPHPGHRPGKIPVDEYLLSDSLLGTMMKLIKAIGFTSSYLFPDYAGLSDRIKKGYLY